MVAVGQPSDLTLFTEFGVMPVTGHWHMRHRVDQYLEQRAQEVDATEPGVHVLTPERAVEEWKRLEPAAIGHERVALHDFFGRTRNCLATVDADTGHATALCWVSGHGEIGPGVGQNPEDLVPVVLAALDRVAKMQEPETFGVHLHDRVLVADGPAPPARLQGPLAGLDHVVGAAGGPRPLPADPPGQIALATA